MAHPALLLLRLLLVAAAAHAYPLGDAAAAEGAAAVGQRARWVDDETSGFVELRPPVMIGCGRETEHSITFFWGTEGTYKTAEEKARVHGFHLSLEEKVSSRIGVEVQSTFVPFDEAHMNGNGDFAIQWSGLQEDKEYTMSAQTEYTGQDTLSDAAVLTCGTLAPVGMDLALVVAIGAVLLAVVMAVGFVRKRRIVNGFVHLPLFTAAVSLAAIAFVVHRHVSSRDTSFSRAATLFLVVHGISWVILAVMIARGIGFVRLRPEFSDSVACVVLSILFILVSVLSPAVTAIVLLFRLGFLVIVGANAYNVARALRNMPDGATRIKPFLAAAAIAFAFFLGAFATPLLLGVAFSLLLIPFILLVSLTVILWPGLFILKPVFESEYRFTVVAVTDEEEDASSST